ncbi:MAG: Zn-dependent alcohol dehydrogenase [Acidimicrobiia bacterium]|nr:Zn-dependent alcohol dehydrogenase [Acidimicrobiia bacterium]
MEARAALLTEQPGALSFGVVDVADPGPREVRVRTAACGLCHSDLHALEGQLQTPLPSVVGHEASGIVESVGSEVTDFVPGDRVVACISQFCGSCAACVRGETWLCQRREQPPLIRPDDAPPRLTHAGAPAGQFLAIGGLAEYFLVHEHALVRLRPEMPLDIAALLGCGVLTGYGTVVNRAKVRPDESVVVIGCGGVGLSAIQAAALSGASPIIAIDLHDHALELAKELGATVTINANFETPTKMVRALTGGGADHAIEAIGFPKTMEDAVDMIRPGGTAYLIGIAPIPSTMELSAFRLVWFNRGVQGVLMGANNFRRDIPALADLYLAGRLPLDRLLTDRIPLEEAGTGFDAMRSGSLGRSAVVFP